MQPTPTRWPTLNFVTSAPTLVTRPTISMPPTNGYWHLKPISAHSFLPMLMSGWQMPAISNSMPTSLCPTARRVIVCASCPPSALCKAKHFVSWAAAILGPLVSAVNLGVDWEMRESFMKLRTRGRFRYEREALNRKRVIDIQPIELLPLIGCRFPICNTFLCFRSFLTSAKEQQTRRYRSCKEGCRVKSSEKNDYN